jgi:hypothetical protein
MVAIYSAVLNILVIFELAWQRPKMSELNWSGHPDLNWRPPAPKAGALPGCAMPRHSKEPSFYINLGRAARVTIDDLQFAIEDRRACQLPEKGSDCIGPVAMEVFL